MAGARQRVASSAHQRAGDGGPSGRGIPAGKKQQRWAGAGREPELGGPVERLACRGQVTLSQPDLAERREGLGCVTEVVGARLDRGGLGLLGAALPVAADDTHRGPVGAAVTPEAHRPEVGGAPVDRLGPLDGPPVVEDVQAGAERPAVDHALGQRPELAGGGACHCLVEEGAAVIEAPLVHQAEALKHEAKRLDVAVAGPPADVEGRPGVLHAGVQLHRHQARRAPSATA